MIYTKSIEATTWNDVQSFVLQQLPESTYLEYKSDFPTDLAKTISAMANTFGGVILIGVAEGDDGRPLVPNTGMQLRKGLAEQVTNIVLTNINPPVLPEVAVCVNAAGTHAVVIVRVPQSPEGPHAIHNNTRVYVRTGNRNKPETLATLTQIEWLQSRRAKSNALKVQLRAQAMFRSDALFGYVNRMIGVALPSITAATANLVLSAIPTFPGTIFVRPPQLREVLRKIQVPDYYLTDSVFPLGGSNATLLQDGAYVTARLDGESGMRSYYSELSVFGQLFFRQTLTFKYGNQSLIRASEIFCRLDEFARSAQRFYLELGYQGYISMQCSIYSAHTAPLGHWTIDEREVPTTTCPDESIGHEELFLVGDWERGASAAIQASARTIGWAYNWEFSDTLIQSYYQRHRRVT